MDLTDFKNIMIDEVKFHGKKFIGADEAERKSEYNRFMRRYYESLSHMSSTALKQALKKCSETYDYFPTINKILKFAPAKPVENTFNYHAPIPMTPENKQKIDAVLKRGGLTRIGEKQVRANFALVHRRWPNTDWDEVIEREIKLDAMRPVAGKY